MRGIILSVCDNQAEPVHGSALPGPLCPVCCFNKKTSNWAYQLSSELSDTPSTLPILPPAVSSGPVQPVREKATAMIANTLSIFFIKLVSSVFRPHIFKNAAYFGRDIKKAISYVSDLLASMYEGYNSVSIRYHTYLTISSA